MGIGSSMCLAMRLPQRARDFQWLNPMASPPRLLVARLMQLIVVDGAERDRELIAHLAAHGPRLSKAQVMGVRRGSPANQTGLLADDLEVVLGADPFDLGKRQLALVNPLNTSIAAVRLCLGRLF